METTTRYAHDTARGEAVADRNHAFRELDYWADNLPRRDWNSWGKERYDARIAAIVAKFEKAVR